jgi:hypothetical protein
MGKIKFSCPPSIADLLRKDGNPWEQIDSDATTVTEPSTSTLSTIDNSRDEEVFVAPSSLPTMGKSEIDYPPSPPADMGWNDRSASHQSHILL